MRTESYLQEMKQLLQQYFLLLSGKRPMIGDLTMSKGKHIILGQGSDLDAYTNMGNILPRYRATSSSGSGQVGEMWFWYNPGTQRVYLCYKDATLGIKKVELPL